MSSSQLNATSTASIKPQGGVQSLEVGLTVLDVLIDQNQPMMLKDIAQAIDMHPAKVHRYLVSLVRKNYASQTAEGRYTLGSRVNALSYSGLNQNNLLQLLTLAASDIKDALQCSVQIAKWFAEGPVVIESVESDSPVSIITRIGSRMPLTTSATGRLFASMQPENLVRPLVNNEWLAADPNCDLDSHWLNYQKILSNIRVQGFATVTGDMLKGISAISIPVNQESAISIGTTQAGVNPTQYAITVIGTIEQLPTDSTGQLGATIYQLLQSRLLK